MSSGRSGYAERLHFLLQKVFKNSEIPLTASQRRAVYEDLELVCHLCDNTGQRVLRHFLAQYERHFIAVQPAQSRAQTRSVAPAVLAHGVPAMCDITQGAGLSAEALLQGVVQFSLQRVLSVIDGK